MRRVLYFLHASPSWEQHRVRNCMKLSLCTIIGMVSFLQSFLLRRWCDDCQPCVRYWLFHLDKKGPAGNSTKPLLFQYRQQYLKNYLVEISSLSVLVRRGQSVHGDRATCQSWEQISTGIFGFLALMRCFLMKRKPLELLLFIYYLIAVDEWACRQSPVGISLTPTRAANTLSTDELRGSRYFGWCLQHSNARIGLDQALT